MIKVVAKSKIKEGKIDKYVELTEELINKTREEDKNISYKLFQDLENPNILTFIEEWEDKEGLDKHMESEHFKKIVPMLSEYRIGEGEVNIYKEVN